MFIELVSGVYSVENRWVAGKAGIVLGQRRALAIDTCGYPDEGQAMANFIRGEGSQPSWVALTHGHGDHILGGEAFQGAEVYAHARTPDVIGRQIAGWAERRGERHEQVAASLLWPSVTFSHELTIELGGKHVRMFHAPGHSEDGACALVEEDRLLFGGDTVVTGIVPAIGDGDSRALEGTLRQLLQMQIDILVPGHGPVVHGPGAIRSWLSFWVDYLAGVRAAAQEGLSRGDAPESLMGLISYEAYVGDRLPEEPYGMRHRHRATVTKIVQEEATVGQKAW